MMRTDINLAIVAMVEEPAQTHTNASQEYCYVIEDNSTNPIVRLSTPILVILQLKC